MQTAMYDIIAISLLSAVKFKASNVPTMNRKLLQAS